MSGDEKRVTGRRDFAALAHFIMAQKFQSDGISYERQIIWWKFLAVTKIQKCSFEFYFYSIQRRSTQIKFLSWTKPFWPRLVEFKTFLFFFAHPPHPWLFFLWGIWIFGWNSGAHFGWTKYNFGDRLGPETWNYIWPQWHEENWAPCVSPGLTTSLLLQEKMLLFQWGLFYCEVMKT